MKKCPFCGADIEDTARFCLYCMQPLTEKEQIILKQKKKTKWLIIVPVITLSLMLAIVWFIRPSKQKSGKPSDDSHFQSDSSSNQTVLPDTPSEIELHTHRYSEKNIDSKYQAKAATCLASAVYYYSCTCGEKGNETFSYGALGDHAVVTDKGYSAGCITAGLTDGTHCSLCQAVLVPQEQIPEKGHTFDSENSNAPCSVCGTQPPHTHVYTEKNTDSKYLKEEATCLASAIYYYSCSCGKEGEDTFSYGKRTDHKYITIPGYPADCVNPGLTDATYCPVCYEGSTDGELIEALGHTFEPGDSLPTCLVCREKGDVIVQVQELPFLLNDMFYISSCTYTIRNFPSTSEVREIIFTISYTNVTSDIIRYFPDASLFLPEAGYFISGVSTGLYLQPNQSGTFKITFSFPNFENTVCLIFR